MPRTPYPWRSILVTTLVVTVTTLVLDAPTTPPQPQTARAPLPWEKPLATDGSATEAVGTPQWTKEAKSVDPAADGLTRLPDALPKNPFPLVVEVPRAVKVVDAATFQIGDRFYRLADITPVPPEAECSRRGGGRWNCGMRSRSALRGLIVNKGLQCRSLDPGASSTASAPVDCILGTVRIAKAMVEKGWATPAKVGDRELDAALEAARQAKAGIWVSPDLAKLPSSEALSLLAQPQDRT